MSDHRNAIVGQLHDNAMAKAEQADLHRKRGEAGPAVEFYASAAEWEAKAALLCQYEPSRSILCRSAAWLAIRGRRYEVAIDLCAAGMRPETPGAIRREMTAAMEYARMAIGFLKSLDDAEVRKEQASWGIGPKPMPPHADAIEVKPDGSVWRCVSQATGLSGASMGPFDG